MHGIIGDPSREDKASKSPPLLRFDCYIDTTSWLFPMTRLPSSDWRRLCKLYGGTPRHKENRRLRTLLLSFQCPQKKLIWELEKLVELYDGNLSRCDIACDVRPGSTDLNYIEQTELLWRTMLLRDRNKGPLFPVPNDDGTIGTFWNPFSPEKGDKSPPRDIVLYPDSMSKLPHHQAVAHFDFRLRHYARRKAMREQGIGPGGRSLTELDPSIVLRRHIRIVTCNMERERRRYFQHLTKGQTPEIARRLIDDAKRHGQLEYVQRLHEQFRNCRLVDARNSVTFPHTLTWNAIRRKKQKGVSVGHVPHANDHNGLA